MKQNDLTEFEFLENYKKMSKNYESPSVTNDIVVFTIGEEPSKDIRKLPKKKLELLLVKRNQHPEMGKWGVIGGFLAIDKTFDENVSSILENKLSIKDVYTEQLYTFSEVERDVRKRILSSSYLTLSPKSKFNNIQLNDSILDYSWSTIELEESSIEKVIIHNGFNLIKTIKMYLTLESGEVLNSELNIITTIVNNIEVKEEILLISTDLSFDHAKLIYMAYKRIQNKVSYTNIVFSLVDKYFTLTELQSIYEVILNKEFHKSEFRRIIKPMLIETDKKDSSKGHRPSKLYKYNHDWKINLF